jgi:murein DD-endopeptidase MepM/ murein hydrolase activator NlpD
VKALFLAGVVILAIAAPATLFFLSSESTLQLQPEPKVLASSNTLAVTVANPHGPRSVTATLRQGSAVSTASYQTAPDRLLFWKKKLAPAKISLDLNAGPAQGFKSGPAQLTLETVSNDFRAASTQRSFPVVVNLEPPRVTADSAQHYINLGGAELVTFSVSGYWTEAGVKVGPYKFRSFPLPGSKNPNERFSLFAYPWDTPADAVPLVYATNPAGQQVTAPFWYRLKPKAFRRRNIELTPGFIQKAVSEIDPNGSGEMLDRFLRINRETRRQNNQLIASLRDQSESRFLWIPPFQQLSNSKVEAFFADVRSYIHNGKKVDEQVHLGFDLSKVKEAPVVASNSGKVVYAGRLGIYGNCVVVDHGYTLQSIYGHLSRIAVKQGQSVNRGDELGRSGATGLAGGDHLHFAILLHGLPVSPVEWWDGHWIQDRLARKLGPALPYRER